MYLLFHLAVDVKINGRALQADNNKGWLTYIMQLSRQLEILRGNASRDVTNFWTSKVNDCVCVCFLNLHRKYLL